MIVQDLSISRDWLCVEDNVKAIRELAEVRPGIWNISTGYQTTLGELLEMVGDVPYTVGQERPDADHAYRIDASHTWKTLGWKPDPITTDPRFEEYVR